MIKLGPPQVAPSQRKAHLREEKANRAPAGAGATAMATTRVSLPRREPIHTFVTYVAAIEGGEYTLSVTYTLRIAPNKHYKLKMRHCGGGVSCECTTNTVSHL